MHSGIKQKHPCLVKNDPWGALRPCEVISMCSSRSEFFAADSAVSYKGICNCGADGCFEQHESFFSKHRPPVCGTDHL